MIKKVQWSNYRVLGDLDLDFSKGAEDAYRCIVLAGENGTGKSTVLDSFSRWLFENDLAPFSMVEFKTDTAIYRRFKNGSSWGSGYQVQALSSAGLTTQGQPGNQPTQSVRDIPHEWRGGTFSRAKLGFETGIVMSAGASELDRTNIETDRNDNYAELKQLLIDIDVDDKRTIGELYETGGRQIQPGAADGLLKLNRFKNAFNHFFTGIKFEKIGKVNNQYQILFNRNGETVQLEDLSSGEKQIVFRGALLLKNVKAISFGVVLVDEPELSMHPKWQRKILAYYKDLFAQNGAQNVQFIFATHSPFVIQEALQDTNDTLVLALREENGKITAKRIVAPTSLPFITPAEVNYEVFGIPSIEYHNNLFGFIQSNVSPDTVAKTDDTIKNSQFYRHQDHAYPSQSPRGTQYYTLPTFIRNQISHPDPSLTYTEAQLITSIELLREIAQDILRSLRPQNNQSIPSV